MADTNKHKVKALSKLGFTSQNEAQKKGKRKNKDKGAIPLPHEAPDFLTHKQLLGVGFTGSRTVNIENHHPVPRQG